MLNYCLNICLIQIKSVISHRFSETDNNLIVKIIKITIKNEEVQL